MSADPPLIQLPALVGGQAESWRALAELATLLGENWLLVGGQMVFLHEIERHAAEVRPTEDVDVVVNLRVEPAVLGNTHAVLIEAGFSQDLPSPEGLAHRYRRCGATIDVLAPDNLGSRAVLTLGSGRTLQAPGTTQAFRRSAVVRAQLDDGTTALIRRPTLVGAVLGKTAAVVKIASLSTAERAKHLRDVDSLAKLLGIDDRDTAKLSAGELRMLQAMLDRYRTNMSPLGIASIDRLAAHMPDSD